MRVCSIFFQVLSIFMILCLVRSFTTRLLGSSRHEKRPHDIRENIHGCGKQGRHDSVVVVVFGFNGHLRQYFSLYRTFSQREGERRVEKVKTTPTHTYCKRNRPLPCYHPNCRTPRHWKFTQNHRITQPPRP